jgi:hypothetical protein
MFGPPSLTVIARGATTARAVGAPPPEPSRGAVREELVVREEVDGASGGAGEQVGECVDLVGFRLGEEAVGGSLDEDVRVADRDNGAGEHADLDRLGRSAFIEVGGLVGDVEVDVDDLRGDRGARGEQGDLLRFSGAAVDDRAPGEPADQPDGSRFDVAKERGNDDRDDEQHSNEYRTCDRNGVHGIDWREKKFTG